MCANKGSANETHGIAKRLMASGAAVNTSQRDIGMHFWMSTSDSTLIGSYGRSTNDDYVSSVLEMNAMKNMVIGQML